MPSTLEIKDKSEAGKLIKIAPFTKEIRKTEPHRHNNYFEIIYLSEGSGNHCIDHNQYPVNPPVLFFIRREQVHHWELLTAPEGYVLILKKAFVDRSLDGELKSLLAKVSGLTSIQVNEAETINLVFQLLARENSADGENNFFER